MLDKRLLPSAWEAFSKGRPLKAGTLTAALRDLGTLDSLEAVHTASAALRRSSGQDKEVPKYLDGIDKAVLVLRRRLEDEELEATKKLAEAEAAESDQLPLLLGKRMVPLLNKVRAGEVMQSMVAIAGRRTAVCVSRRFLGPQQAAVMKRYLRLAGTVKIMKGVCIFEQNAHTFVLERGMAGLAKKLKPALHEQTGLRLAVRVRGQADGKADGTGRSFVT